VADGRAPLLSHHGPSLRDRLVLCRYFLIPDSQKK
jgi:hypothetical protein